MIFLENIRMAFTSLLANKSRALLTMLGIIIGIASVIAIMTVGNSLTLSVSTSMQAMGANNINVMLTQEQQEADERENGIVFGQIKKNKMATEEDYFTDEMIYSLLTDFSDSIEAVSVSESVGSSTVKKGTNSATISITGVSLGYFIANDITMVAGEKISLEESQNARNVAMVADKFVDEIFECPYEDAIGKDFTVDLNGQNVEYTICGVYEYEESAAMSMFGSSSSTSCYIPLTTAQDMNHSKNYSSLSIVAKVGVDSEDLAAKVENYLNGFYRSNQYFEVTAFSMASMVSIMGDMMGTITTAISIVAGIALLVGGIGVMNIMLVSITERTREIGTRKALGATNSSIRIQFITESMIMCLVGGVIGVILGIALGAFGAELLGYAASPSLESILVSLLFSLAIGLFFGYYPANKAAKMNPIEALRYE